MIAIRLGLDVLVSPCAAGHNDADRVAIDRYVERPLAALDPSDRILLRNLPRRAVVIHAADMGDPLVRVVAVVLVDASNSVSHAFPPTAARHGADEQVFVRPERLPAPRPASQATAQDRMK